MASASLLWRPPSFDKRSHSGRATSIFGGDPPTDVPQPAGVAEEIECAGTLMNPTPGPPAFSRLAAWGISAAISGETATTTFPSSASSISVPLTRILPIFPRQIKKTTSPTWSMAKKWNPYRLNLKQPAGRRSWYHNSQEHLKVNVLSIPEYSRYAPTVWNIYLPGPSNGFQMDRSWGATLSNTKTGSNTTTTPGGCWKSTIHVGKSSSPRGSIWEEECSSCGSLPSSRTIVVHAHPGDREVAECFDDGENDG